MGEFRVEYLGCLMFPVLMIACAAMLVAVIRRGSRASGILATWRTAGPALGMALVHDDGLRGTYSGVDISLSLVRQTNYGPVPPTVHLRAQLPDLASLAFDRREKHPSASPTGDPRFDAAFAVGDPAAIGPAARRLLLDVGPGNITMAHGVLWMRTPNTDSQAKLRQVLDHAVAIATALRDPRV